MPFAAKNILSSLKIRAARNYLGTERTFWPKRDWYSCTLAVSYQEISNVKRHITSGCSRLKRLWYVFSTTRDCARVNCVLHFSMQFSFHLRTMRETKSTLKHQFITEWKFAKRQPYCCYLTKELKNRAGWILLRSQKSALIGAFRTICS